MSAVERVNRLGSTEGFGGSGLDVACDVEGLQAASADVPGFEDCESSVVVSVEVVAVEVGVAAFGDD